MNDPAPRRAAVDSAYRDHADDVFRVAYAILRDSDAAADATHDTFARAYERWDQYDADRSLRAWLHGIVTNASLDALRRRRVRARTVAIVGRVGEIASGGAAPDPAPEIVRRHVVDAGLAAIAPTARAAVVLRHYYGYDYAEIAAFLRTSPGNVGSILSRAHAELRHRLAAEAPPARIDVGHDTPRTAMSEPPDRSVG
jgi:RNA polymerase sigma-70 factor (ECF subfamily)